MGKLAENLHVTAGIRIDDPGQLLSRNEGKTLGANLLIGVASEGLILRLAPIFSADSVGRSHQIAVPYNSRLKLVIRSAYFQIADTLGVPLPRAQSTIVAFNTPGDKDPEVIVLKVTGTER